MTKRNKKLHKEAFKIMKKAKNVIILPHANADGDAIGTAFSVKAILDALKVNSIVLMEEGNDLLDVIVQSENFGNISNPDLIIAVDSSDLKRLGERQGLFETAKNTICFDHHKTNEKFAKVNIIEETYGSCGEVIYDFCIENNIKINKAIANNLLLAIASDTGGFRYSNVRAKTHIIAAELMEKGANTDAIMTALFSSSTLSRTMLMKCALDTLKIHDSGIATLEVTREMIEKTGASDQETQSLVNIGRNIKGVKFSIMIREKENGEVKISTRSNTDDIDASEICAAFGGGGHARAAGINVENVTIQEAKEKLLEYVENYIRNSIHQ